MMSTERGRLQAISLRLGPGEDVCRGLADAVGAVGAQGGVVVSAVGSLAEVSYALVRFDAEGRPAYTDARRLEGAIEMLGLQGHFGRTEAGDSTFHLHGTFGLASGDVIGGHVLGARVLVTVEATLLVGSGAEWKAVPYMPDDEDGVREGREMNVFLPTSGGASR